MTQNETIPLCHKNEDSLTDYYAYMRKIHV